ncbi:MAG TPA: lytic transglycosylase domain-containing protein [bacterium]
MKSLLNSSLILLSIFSLCGCDLQRRQKLDYLETTANNLSEVHLIDLSRQQAHQKVMQIINRFNPEMAREMKQAVADEIFEMSVKYPNLDVDLICATITHESGRSWNPQVVSNAGAMGLMQIMPSTGMWLSKYERIKWTNGEEILFNPIYNIRLGSRYLSALIETYDIEGGLAAYNGGPRRAKRWLASNKAHGILWSETQNYIPNVLKLYDEYKSSTL